MADKNSNLEELLGEEENLNKAIEYIKSKGNVVMSIKDSYAEKQKDKDDVGAFFGNKLSAIDKSLSENLGIDKEGNESTDEFVKRVIPTLKSKLDTLEKAQEEGLTGSESLKLERDSLLDKLNISTKEKEDLKKGFETTLNNKDKEFIVNAEISKLSFKEGIELVLDPAKKEFINNVLSASTLEDGKLIFKDDQGVPKRNDKNDLITVFEMATKKFESVLNTDNTKQGLGNGDNTKNNSKSSLSLFAASRVPTDFGDIQAIVKAWHLSKGVKIINGSKEMNQGISELRKIYNI